MKKYMILTRDVVGNPKKMFYTTDLATPDFIRYVRTNLFGLWIGATTVCRVFSSGKHGKPHYIVCRGR